eukprot:Opistho-2@41402
MASNSQWDAANSRNCDEHITKPCNAEKNPAHSGVSGTVNTQRSSQGSDEAATEAQPFLSALFCLLARYETYHSWGYQAAVMDPVFDALGRDFGVSHECFASPLNSTLPSYSSAFSDVDTPFGSVGNFFRIREILSSAAGSPLRGCDPQRANGGPPGECGHTTIGGSFEANPPFIEEYMLAMALYMERWFLDLADRAPLSFVIFLPAWEDTPATTALSSSAYLRKRLVFEKLSHSYRHGAAHKSDDDRGSASVSVGYCRSFVFFLQNAPAAACWGLEGESRADGASGESERLRRFCKAFTSTGGSGRWTDPRH